MAEWTPTEEVLDICYACKFRETRTKSFNMAVH